VSPLPLVDFPENFIDELQTSLEASNLFDKVLRRPIQPTDPNGTAAVFAMDWSPQEMAIGQVDPAVTRYQVAIQTFIKNGNEQAGVIAHSQLAKKVRVMLYRDADLRVRLGTLSTSDGEVVERVQRWGVSRQRYLSNEIQKSFLFLAVTEVWLESEIV
jgi:hypothetical protein